MRKLLLPTIILAALGATAGPAAANTFCVSDPSCAGKDEGANVQNALIDAGANPGPDRVQVGAGTFTGPFAYNAGTPANSVELVGAGKDATKLTIPQLDNLTVLTLHGPSSKVSDLSIRLESAQSDTGIDLPDGAGATRVAIGGNGNSAAGVRLGGGTLDHSSISFGLQSTNVAVRTDSSPGATIADDDLAAGTGVIGRDPAGVVRVVRTRVRSMGNGIGASCGRIDVDDTLVDLRGGVNRAAFFASADPCAAGANNTARLRHVTLIGGAPKSVGVLVTSGSNESRSAIVTDSVIAGFAQTAVRGAFAGQAAVSLDHSAYDPATILDNGNGNGGTGSVTQTAPLGTSFGFVDPTTDFHLRPDSPLVDAGRPDPLAADESSTDLDGNDRITDGNGDGKAVRDVGAFERPGVPGPPQPVSTGGDAPSNGGSGSDAGAGAGASAGAGQPGGTDAGSAQPLKLTLAGRKRQHLGRRGRVVVTATADAPVTLNASVAKGKPVATAKAAASSRLVVTLPKGSVRKARRALRRHKRASAVVTVTAHAADGRTAVATQKIGLVR